MQIVYKKDRRFHNVYPRKLYLWCLFGNLEEKFVKKILKLERANADPQYLRDQIRSAFPELSAGNVDSSVLKLWQVRESKTQLSPLPVDVNNARALFSYDQLKRSCVYITADVSTNLHLSNYTCTLYNICVWCQEVHR